MEENDTHKVERVEECLAGHYPKDLQVEQEDERKEDQEATQHQEHKMEENQKATHHQEEDTKKKINDWTQYQYGKSTPPLKVGERKLLYGQE